MTVTLPEVDNTSQGLLDLRRANEYYRHMAWPEPYDRTTHSVVQCDARHLCEVADESVHLIVTSPPYWTLKEYPQSSGQLGAIDAYEQFLGELDKVWQQCERVLVPGGRICCVVGDVCLPRRQAGRHLVMPLHSDIQVRTRATGLDNLTPILWHKISNGKTEARGNGAGFYGKPYQPGGIIKNEIEYILFMRKGHRYRTATPLQKALSALTKSEMQMWWQSIWDDIRGTSTRNGHPAPYPVELAERLIRMFSFAGDTVLDPFLGTGSTTLAAIQAGRNSIGVEIDPGYVAAAKRKVKDALDQKRQFGAVDAMNLEISDFPHQCDRAPNAV